MRVVVELLDEQAKALEDLAKVDKRPQAALVRDAVDVYLRSRRDGADILESAFGSWANRAIDGVTVQRRRRQEWSARCSIPTS